MIRRAAFAAGLLLVLSTASASAGEPPVVQMLSSSFSPALIKIPVGETVTWDNGSGLTHTTTADKFGYWDRTVSTASETDVLFARAGTWTYHCEIHSGMTGKVKVRMSSFPSFGTIVTTFDLRVASVNLPPGFVEDIQRRKAGRTFKLWRTVTTQTTSWTPGSTGTWEFRARMRKTSNGAHTGWSQPLSIVIN